ncbi:MAG TPA: MFS transporter [Pseudolabrys sp.]|nr:MFS transporter [Pseudolabrys sp.]
MAAQSAVSAVANAMDEMSFGKFHWRVMSLIIAGLFFDLFDVAVLGSLAPDLIRTQFAAPANIAVIASATFFGLLVGSVIQGELTDRFGRKVVYQANLLIYGLATIAAAASPNYMVLAALRFVAGLGLGAEIPLAYAYAAEFSPRRSRGSVMAFLNLVGGNLPFPLAILFSLAFRETIGWRGIFIVIGVCALIVFVFRISLPESPRWLAANGKIAQARDVLKTMGVPVALPGGADGAAPARREDPLLDVLSNYTMRVVALMVALFCSFAALYGLVTWLPTLMGAQGFTITKSLSFTLAMTCAFPVSSIMLILLVDKIGRIKITVGSFVLAGICAMVFRSSSSESAILVMGFLMSFFVVTTANTIEILCGELFPTNARSSGSGLGFGAGRAGAMLASFIVPTVVATYGAGGVYAAIAGVLAVGAVSTLMLGLEPARMALESIAPTEGRKQAARPAAVVTQARPRA